MVNREDMALVQRLFESAHNALQVELVAFGVVPEDMAIITRDFQKASASYVLLSYCEERLPPDVPMGIRRLESQELIYCSRVRSPYFADEAGDLTWRSRALAGVGLVVRRSRIVGAHSLLARRTPQ